LTPVFLEPDTLPPLFIPSSPSEVLAPSEFEPKLAKLRRAISFVPTFDAPPAAEDFSKFGRERVFGVFDLVEKTERNDFEGEVRGEVKFEVPDDGFLEKRASTSREQAREVRAREAGF